MFGQTYIYKKGELRETTTAKLFPSLEVTENSLKYTCNRIVDEAKNGTGSAPSNDLEAVAHLRTIENAGYEHKTIGCYTSTVLIYIF